MMNNDDLNGVEFKTIGGDGLRMEAGTIFIEVNIPHIRVEMKIYLFCCRLSFDSSVVLMY